MGGWWRAVLDVGGGGGRWVADGRWVGVCWVVGWCRW